MAARMRKYHQDEWPFYVYEILNKAGETVYIGKGSAYRMTVSKRHKNGDQAVESARFKNEEDAYDYEVELIALKKPCLNKHPGGNGSRKGCVKGNKLDRDSKLMNKIGTRAFAARMILNYYKTFRYITSKIDGEKIFKYSPEIAMCLTALDINKLQEVGYGSRA